MEKYHEMFKDLPLPAVVIDRKKGVLDANDAFKTTFPGNREVHHLIGTISNDIDELFQSSERNATMETRILDGHENMRMLRIRISKVNGQKEQTAIILLTDITERRRHIEEIERLASIVESSEDAIFSVSSDRRIMSWNKGAEKIYGYALASIVNTSTMKLVPKSTADALNELLAKTYGGESVIRHETICCHRDGHLFPVSMSLSPLVYHGNIIGVTIVARDISLRREAEQKLAISHRQLKSLMYETVESLSTAHEKRDLYTAGHQRSVSMLSCCIADEMNLSYDQLEGIRISGLLHDIGKVCIPMAILSKPAKLTPEEMALMRQHPSAGYEIVKNVPFTWPVKDIILQHHERMDGTGYPKGLSGEAIRLEARILAVADVLEAMSAHRPYRPALGLDAALAEVKNNAGSKYDETVCQAVEKLFEDGVIRIEQGQLICSL